MVIQAVPPPSAYYLVNSPRPNRACHTLGTRYFSIPIPFLPFQRNPSFGRRNATNVTAQGAKPSIARVMLAKAVPSQPPGRRHDEVRDPRKREKEKTPGHYA